MTQTNNPYGVSTIDQMFHTAANTCSEWGEPLDSRDGGSMEYLGWVCRMNSPAKNLMIDKVRNISRAYAVAELSWYLGGLEAIRWLTPYAPQYVNFSDDGETAYGAYGPRGFNMRSLRRIVDILTASPNSRQAVISLWNPKDIHTVAANASKDIPCTIALQFFVRSGKLNCIGTMRSNDVWLGLPYDVFCFTTIQAIIATELGIPMGWYQHQVGSLHVYDRNEKKVQDSLMKVQSWDSEEGEALDLNAVQKLVRCFKMVTQSPNDNLDTGLTNVNEMVQCCAHRLNPETEKASGVWEELNER